MTMQLDELIQKIKREGVDAARQEAHRIEEEALRKREEILAQARRDAERIIEQAENEARRFKEAARTAVQQAARDCLLELRQRIEAMLSQLLQRQIGEVLDKEALCGLILEAVKKGLSQADAREIVIHLPADDAADLAETLRRRLAEQFKAEGITVTADPSLKGGFTISYDADRSQFDFSTTALAEALMPRVNAEVARLLQQAAQGNGSTSTQA